VRQRNEAAWCIVVGVDEAGDITQRGKDAGLLAILVAAHFRGNRMLRHAITTLAVLILLSGCASSPTGRTQLALMPDSQMNDMGLQAFANIKKEKLIEPGRSANSYVQCVAQAIVREVGGNWEVVIFKDENANAFALPGGKIGVNTGLLKVAENQDQLATVISHEVMHVLSNHANERVSQKFAVEQGLGLINAAANPQTGTGKTLMGLLGVGAQYGVLLPYNRIQESEADLLGLDLMARAGFDPRESIKFWINMGRSGGGQPPQFLSTHPSHASRISDLQKHMPNALRLQAQARQFGKRPVCR
jgi:predicted Zn-dependent protease